MGKYITFCHCMGIGPNFDPSLKGVITLDIVAYILSSDFFRLLFPCLLDTKCSLSKNNENLQQLL